MRKLSKRIIAVAGATVLAAAGAATIAVTGATAGTSVISFHRVSVFNRGAAGPAPAPGRS
jgi:uncharacterized membrane protein